MKLRFHALALVGLFTVACSSANEDLGSSESQVTVCGQTTIKGIDVYHGDNGGNAINWTKVKAAGITFAFAKATESTNFTDSAFATNWAGMKSAGIVRGAYHFFHADVDPTQQATFFLSTVGKVSQGDMLVLDLETTNGQTQATIEAHAATFMAAVKSQSGVTPILYTSPAFLSSFSSLGAYPLWVANYGVNCPTVPSAWKTYEFWQSTGTGSLSALSGAVDLDTFNGTLSDLLAFVGETQTDGGTGPGDASTNDGAVANDASTAKDANGDAQSISADASGDAAEPPNWGNASGGCTAAPSRTPRDMSFIALLFAAVVLMIRRR